jgi:hypothetical protein
MAATVAGLADTIGGAVVDRLIAVIGMPLMQPPAGGPAPCIRKSPASNAHSSMAREGRRARAGEVTAGQHTLKG